jgi:hypothetical protein
MISETLRHDIYLIKQFADTQGRPDSKERYYDFYYSGQSDTGYFLCNSEYWREVDQGQTNDKKPKHGVINPEGIDKTDRKKYDTKQQTDDIEYS